MIPDQPTEAEAKTLLLSTEPRIWEAEQARVKTEERNHYALTKALNFARLYGAGVNTVIAVHDSLTLELDVSELTPARTAELVEALRARVREHGGFV